LLLAGGLTVTVVKPEDEGGNFVRNIGEILLDYVVIHPRKKHPHIAFVHGSKG
jgi:hypothetical protein